MGTSAWVIFAAPFMTASPADVAVDTAPSAAASLEIVSGDIFSSETILDEDAMKAASGGADTAIDIVIENTVENNTDNSVDYDIGDVAVNESNNEARLQNNSANGATAGNISNIMVEGNRGLATVINNAGHNVSIQTIYNVNIHNRPAAPDVGN